MKNIFNVFLAFLMLILSACAGYGYVRSYYGGYYGPGYYTHPSYGRVYIDSYRYYNNPRFNVYHGRPYNYYPQFR